MKRLMFTALLGTLLVGCGYTTGSLLPAKFRSIEIPRFKNAIEFSTESDRYNQNIYLPRLETRVHEVVVDRFQYEGNLKIADSNGDLRLEGELIGFERQELRVDSNDDVEEYRTVITINYQVYDTEDESIFLEGTLSGEGTYFTRGPQASTEAEAIQEALDDLARRLVERIVEHW